MSLSQFLQKSIKNQSLFINIYIFYWIKLFIIDNYMIKKIKIENNINIYIKNVFSNYMQIKIFIIYAN